uniref:cystatin-POGU1-like isoform X2 n=1 Tax=Doryrhamphus excisus TaxID=161450 RepID=UPI0025AE61AD|nr:cystatin-POGU1-like isoform X2 [Doryrhamphus excisus]
MEPLWKLARRVHTMMVWASVLCFVAFLGVQTDGRARMTGQPRQVPVTDHQVLAAAHFAVAEFNRVNPEQHFFYRMLNITSAEVQVVAGLKYYLVVQLDRMVVCRTNTTQACPYHFLIKFFLC